ncbi:DUF6083 domain-containing protein [Streptomyces stramineus]
MRVPPRPVRDRARPLHPSRIPSGAALLRRARYQRWLIRSDGKAVNTGEAELPATTRCRFPHRIVCPCSNPPSGTTLRALWEYNSGVAPRLDPPAAEAG